MDKPNRVAVVHFYGEVALPVEVAMQVAAHARKIRSKYENNGTHYWWDKEAMTQHWLDLKFVEEPTILKNEPTFSPQKEDL